MEESTPMNLKGPGQRERATRLEAAASGQRESGRLGILRQQSTLCATGHTCR